MKVIIHNHKAMYGRNGDEHDGIAINAKRIIENNVSIEEDINIEMYNLEGEKHKYKAGSKRRIVIFHNGTDFHADGILSLKKPELINGIENNFTEFLSPLGTGILISSENGIPLAEWIEETQELNILFNLLGEYEESNINIFRFIICEANRLVFSKRNIKYSWKNTDNKELLKKDIINGIKEEREHILKQTRIDINRDEERMINLRRDIKCVSDRLISRRHQIELNESISQETINQIFKDYDLIIKHEKVKDLRVNKEIIKVFTEPLIITASNEKRYYGGEYVIEINTAMSDVTFTGKTSRKGWWGDKQAHPHVSTSGDPCLGTSAPIIAELCSQKQIYALVLVCIDFLEATDITDCAGKYINYWDKVDENGNIIESVFEEEEEEEEERFSCDRCGELTHEQNRVYEDLTDDGDIEEERYVCDRCFDEHYCFNVEHDEYIRIGAGEDE